MTEKNRGHRHQNRFLINLKFQFKYTLIVVAVSSAVFAILGYKLYQSELGKQKLLQIQNPDIMQLVQSHDHQFLYYLIGFFVVQIVSILFLGIVLTHRIAGPIFRVQRTLEQAIETREVIPIRPVRKNDEFQGFFDALQNFIEIFTQQPPK